MFSIGRNFHLIHMTDDVEVLDAWYADVFGTLRFMNHSTSDDFLKRDASLVLIGDLCVELMAPSFRVDGWDEVAIGRFYKRFGKRWHSIAWYTHSLGDLTALHHHLIANDVRVYSGGGSLSPDEPQPGGVFTHPGDTYTQLEFIAPEPRLDDPRFHGSFDPRWWSTSHPLGVSGHSHVTLAVHDATEAAARYVTCFGATPLFEGEMALTATKSSFVGVGDLVVEMAQPLEPTSAIARDMAENHQSLYAATLRVHDLGAARDHLLSKGIAFSDDDGTTVLSDPATTHGVVWGFTTWDVPHAPGAKY
jgi:hypothetical protein